MPVSSGMLERARSVATSERLFTRPSHANRLLDLTVDGKDIKCDGRFTGSFS